MPVRWAYRARQFLARLVVRRRAIDQELVRAILPAAPFELFLSMPLGDQRHALCVLQGLRAQGIGSMEAAQAALLHDVGKVGGGLTLAHRVLVVLLDGLGGGLVTRLAADRPGSWRYPFFVQAHHARLGAERSTQVGCSAATVTLIANHEDGAGPLLDDALRESLLALRKVDADC